MLKNLTISFAFVGFFFHFGCNKSKHFRKSSNHIGQEVVLEQRVYSQFNLEYLAIGRNSLEVESLMGVPEGRSLGQNGDFLLDYRRPVKDIESGEIYDWSLITFHFNQGKCTSLEFGLANKPTQLTETKESFPSN